MNTCFVISPIGADGSEQRKNADDLFDLIIQPALEIFDFKVIRGDKLLTVSAITDDIVSYIQNSELCIIDLTGHNPNVFYECGRRHETARPYIHIKKKGEQIPFDISGIRTIDYDLSDGRKIRESIEYLRKFIAELETIGYTPPTTFSLNNLATTLTRIERKLDSVTSAGFSPVSIGAGTGENMHQGSPYRLYLENIKAGEYEKATIALKRFMKINSDADLHLDLCTYLTDAFEPSAVNLSKSILETRFDTIKISTITYALDSLARFYADAMSIDSEYDTLKEYISKSLNGCSNDKERSSLYNVAASLEYYMKNDLKALDYQKKALELEINSPFLYNLAKIYEALDRKNDVITALDDYIYFVSNVVTNEKEKVSKNEVTYLEYAKTKYKETNHNEKASKVDILIQQLIDRQSSN